MEKAGRSAWKILEFRNCLQKHTEMAKKRRTKAVKEAILFFFSSFPPVIRGILTSDLDIGHFLDVMNDCRHQALSFYFPQSSEAGVAVCVELFGVGETSLHCLRSSAFDLFSPHALPIGFDLFRAVFPDMTSDLSLVVFTPGAVMQKRADCTLPGIGKYIL